MALSQSDVTWFDHFHSSLCHPCPQWREACCLKGSERATKISPSIELLQVPCSVQPNLRLRLRPRPRFRHGLGQGDVPVRPAGRHHGEPGCGPRPGEGGWQACRTQSSWGLFQYRIFTMWLCPLNCRCCRKLWEQFGFGTWNLTNIWYYVSTCSCKLGLIH